MCWPFLRELFKDRQHFIEPSGLEPKQLRELRATAGRLDRTNSWPESGDPELAAVRQFAILIDAFGSQYRWRVGDTLDLTLDEIYLVQDAMVLRLNHVYTEQHRPGKDRGRGPEGQLSAEQAFAMYGGVDE